ncbi:MAG: hypothetical protein M1821_000480 [Bathelium mastoideum]|nr:MAG: hypothetical protein M1821_000480 [Bathelium mastoideum]
MEEVLGIDHLDTLWAKENLARVMVDLNIDDLEQAEILIKEVLDKRRATLGKEHPFTLLAMANTAFIQNAYGRDKEAEELIHAGLNIANRNFARDHVGILNCRNRRSPQSVHDPSQCTIFASTPTHLQKLITPPIWGLLKPR